MLKEAINRILDLAEPTVIELAGENYTDRKMYRIDKALRAEPLQVHTLSAICDYVISGADDGQENINQRFIIHVEDYNNVRLYHELDDDKKRECLVHAEFQMQGFPFGRWLDVESFIINTQTSFAGTDASKQLMKLMGTVTADEGVTLGDDGISQRVTARKGISLAQQVSVPNPVLLSPYRTFPEIQPSDSPFIFRVKDNGGMVCAALFEADGDAWKNQIIQSIKSYFENSFSESYADKIIILA